MPTIKKTDSSEAGVTLVELIISMAIISLISVAGYQMLLRSQKYSVQKKLVLSTQSEIDQLLSVIKKDWEYRSSGDGIVFPKSGHKRLLTATTECGLDVRCPKLRVWIKRTVNGNPITDEVMIENICLRPTDRAVMKEIAALNPAAKLDSTCSSCQAGEIPAVRVSGVDINSRKVVLAAENRIFPQNATNLDKVNTDAVIGMQACFLQKLNNSPISVDVRAMYRDQSEKNLKLVQKTQVYPFENFAKIRLEQ
jgi:prepilin-type N-terminal cleavage/methylation domain-containing protein